MAVYTQSNVPRGLKYATHLIFRPFDGYWDLKHEGRGNTASATIILLAAVISVIFNKQYSGYFFSHYKPETFNILVEVATLIIPFGLWVVANWCLTTLMDGEGSMRDVYIASAYALTPVVLIYVPLTIISQVMSLSEQTYYTFFMMLALVWSGFLMVIGMMVTHQYSVSKTLVTCLLVILGMCMILFIALLFYSVLQKVLFFIMNSYNELSFRLY